MKAIGEKTTIVLAGAFNPAILRPPWVAVHGLGYPENQEFPVEMLAPMGAGVPRFSFDGLSYSAAYGALTMHLGAADLNNCRRSVDVMAKILEMLPHTPVAGLGFNFGFLIEEPADAFLQLLVSSDAMTDSFPGEPQVVTRKWGNTVKWEDALVNVECEFAGGQATVTFNFHYSTASAQEANAVLKREDVYEKHLERAVAAATALTGQQLET